MTPELERAQLWTWARRELGDEVCDLVQTECDQRPEGTPCICAGKLRKYAVLSAFLPGTVAAESDVDK